MDAKESLVLNHLACFKNNLEFGLFPLNNFDIYLVVSFGNNATDPF
jgi:hypothetical protein